MPAQEQRAVEEDGQPETELKGGFARLVAKEPLPCQCPRPTAAEGEEVQGLLTDALPTVPGREFVDPIDKEGDEAEEAVDDDEQLVTSEMFGFGDGQNRGRRSDSIFSGVSVGA